MNTLAKSAVRPEDRAGGRPVKSLLKNKPAVLGLGVFLLLLLTALFAPFIAPHDPTGQDCELRLLPPCPEFPCGTDDLGRDIFSRVIYGSRYSLSIALIVVTIAATFGTLVGLVAGYYGGKADEILMRIVDILLAFPGLILALAIVGALGPGLANTTAALAAVFWVRYARLVRGSVLSLKEKEFILAARAMGSTNPYIIFKHILPNVLNQISVMATIDMGIVILAVASLSFLGLGAQPPLPEWGTMLNEGKSFMQIAPWLTIFPGVAIMLSVLAFNLLGDGLREMLDPKGSQKRIS